jgi:hypothetical protein
MWQRHTEVNIVDRVVVQFGANFRRQTPLNRCRSAVHETRPNFSIHLSEQKLPTLPPVLASSFITLLAL